MPLQATSGAASYDAFGGGVAVVPTYIEDVFSCFLYTGTGASQTITNGIDLSTKGGLVWLKGRSGATNHALYDTARGATKDLYSNSTPAETTQTTGLTAFNGTGFSIGALAKLNTNAANYASWTFRKQPKFFDVVTFTKSTANLSVPHNLGSVPGCVIIKATNIADEWPVYHRGLTSSSNFVYLNRTYAQDTAGSSWITPTSTTIELNNIFIPADGNTYVAYLFAHDAGGFGLTGTDNVISCGGFTANGNNTITLGYEPQWVMVRRVSSAGNDWEIYDTMRGSSLTGSQVLVANTSGAEGVGGTIYPTATGFYISSYGSGDIIYIAIRRGPMKVPTTGTSVYKSSLLAGNSSTQQITDLDFPPDLVMTKARDTSYGNRWTDRLRGFGYALRSDDVGAELNNTTIGVNPFNMNGYTLLGGNPYNASGFNYVNHAMRRAPSFFDEVCYTGTGSATTVSHNLAAVPELMIVKWRTGATGEDWYVYAGSQGNTKYLSLNLTASIVSGSSLWNSTTPTSSVFSLGSSASVNGSGYTYVAYLFATCAGVSKVGSYTGNGTTQTINCGFGAGGARFVLIKRTDSTGDWYVYDTVRGMTTSTDPYLLFNTTDPEVATLGSVTTVSTGFALNSTILAAINVNAGTYIFLAIA